MEPVTIQLTARERTLVLAALSYAEANYSDVNKALEHGDGLIKIHGIPAHPIKQDECEILSARIFCL
jgi:hypothetical protein